MLQSLFIWELNFSNIVNIIKECPSFFFNLACCEIAVLCSEPKSVPLYVIQL